MESLCDSNLEVNDIIDFIRHNAPPRRSRWPRISLKSLQLAKPTLDTVPPEIHNKIFAHLDPVTSLCVGLASKRLYEVHKLFHGVGNLSLLSQTQFFEFGARLCLVQLLEEWLEGHMSARMMKFYMQMAALYASEDAKQLRNFIRIWKKVPRYELEDLMAGLDGHGQLVFWDDVSRASLMMQQLPVHHCYSTSKLFRHLWHFLALNPGGLQNRMLESLMPSLDTLPRETHLQIFSNLDPASSACLGLTSKKFYSLYQVVHGVGNVSLLSRTSFRGIGEQFCLFELLGDWMGYRIGSPLLDLYERLAREWNDAEDLAFAEWIKLFADRLARDEPTNDTLLEPLARTALKIVNTLPRAEVEALLKQ